MAVLQVLLDEHDNVLGTATLTPGATGSAPTAVLVARADQRVVEITVGSEASGLSAAELHQFIAKAHQRTS